MPGKVHIVEGKIRQLRELFSVSAKLQSKRVAMINTIHGYMLQDGRKLPKKFFDRRDWKEQLEKVKLGDGTRPVVGSFMTSIEALLTSEAQLTAQIVAIQDERLDLLDTPR